MPPGVEAQQPMSWRDRRRSRLAEVADGAAMMYADVAVVRATVLAAVMLAVAFLARHRSGFAVALAVAAGAFLFAEMINTLVEMLVDRISLEANVFSARIKHAAAFVSACVGMVSVALLAAVAYQLWCGGSADGLPAQERAREPGGRAIAAENAAARAENAARAAVAAAHAARAGNAARAASGPAAMKSLRAEGEGGQPEPAPSRPTAEESAPSRPTAEESAPPAPAALEPDFLTRWARSAASSRPFASRRVVHPLQWEARTRMKKRYRRRRA